jgi:hypothetical protein
VNWLLAGKEVSLKVEKIITALACATVIGKCTLQYLIPYASHDTLIAS